MTIIKKNKIRKIKLFGLAYIILTKNSSKRRFWVHPYLQNKSKSGCYEKIVLELEKHPELYFVYFRMNKHTFNTILKLLNKSLIPIGTNFRISVQPKEKLVIALRFLASGWTFKDLSIIFFLGHSTILKIVYQVLAKIKEIIMPIAMPIIDKSKWEEVRKQFFKKWNFPNCLGALDGKHIDSFAFNNTSSQNFNYKKRFSTILMALVDANYKFLMIDIEGYGSMADSTVFSQSTFGKLWLSNDPRLNLPDDIPLPYTTKPLPNVIVADEAFSLKGNILRPYTGTNQKLTYSKRILNYRLSRARRIVENAFGICAHTWRVLLKRIENNEEYCKLIVTACVTLHNFLRIEPSANQNILSNSIGTNQINNNTDPYDIRDQFANWCINEGKSLGRIKWYNE